MSFRRPQVISNWATNGALKEQLQRWERALIDSLLSLATFQQRFRVVQVASSSDLTVRPWDWLIVNGTYSVRLPILQRGDAGAEVSVTRVSGSPVVQTSESTTETLGSSAGDRSRHYRWDGTAWHTVGAR